MSRSFWHLPVALLLGACLSRTDLGTQPSLLTTGDRDGAVDSGGDGTDAGPDDPRRADLAELVRKLRGRWTGVAQSAGVEPVRITVSFELDGTYVPSCVDIPSADCSPFPYSFVRGGVRGRYEITDHNLATGAYYGRFHDPFDNRTTLEAELDQLLLTGDALSFERRTRFQFFDLEPSVVMLTRDP